jgi:carbamoyl-phosphate synthase large subunit
MAIERNFGAALNKAFRGLEQTGAGWLSEHPDWAPDLDALTAHLAPSMEPSAVSTHLTRSASQTSGVAQGDPNEALSASSPMSSDTPGESDVGRTRPNRGSNALAEAAVGRLTRSASQAPPEGPLKAFLAPSDSRLWRLIALLRRGVAGDAVQRATGIAAWFVAELERLVELERRMREAGVALDDELLVAAKRACFGDRDIATLTGLAPDDVRQRRDRMSLHPGFAMVDTSAAEFAAETPYYYSTYAAAGSPPEAPPVDRPASVVIGSGPVRIGQGIEFDYCAVQASEALRRLGRKSIMVNSNPETVSTDFDASSRLYFESLDAESVIEVIRAEEMPDAFVQFGGQTPLGLAQPLAAAGVTLRGLDLDAIDQTEERMRFAGLVERLGIPQPQGGMASSIEEAFVVAEQLGYPVIVRPSFVIGGLAVDFAYGPEDLARIIARAVAVDEERPVRIDAYMEGLELDVDAVTDGEDVLIPGLIEHVERAGVHSGDSIGVYPPQRISAVDQQLVVDAITRVARAIGVRGLINGQFIVRDDGVYLLEVNPRASRTVPFISKVTGVPMVELATRVALGSSLASLGWRGGLMETRPLVAVKAPVFSTSKLRGVDPMLGPAMQSTGEVIGIHADPRVAMAKALIAASLRPPLPGPDGALALLSIADRDKDMLGELAARLVAAGYRLCATSGTARELRALGHEVEGVAHVGGEGAGMRTVLEAIESGEVLLVVNTPSPESRPVRDAGEIRLAAMAEGVLCLTSIDTALTAAAALDRSIADRLDDIRPLEEWLGRSLESVP